MKKQIGWDIETNLLYEIDKQLDRLIAVASTIQGGGSTTTTSTTATPTTSTTSTSTSTTSTSSTSTTSTTTEEVIYNMLVCSNKFDSFGTWSETATVLPRTDNGDGTWTLTFAASAGIFQDRPTSPSTTHTFSIDLRDVPADTYMLAYSMPGFVAIGNFTVGPDTNPSTFTRVERSFITAGDATSIWVQLGTITGGDMDMRNAQLNVGASALPYQATACP